MFFTTLFVLLAELLIYFPSAARYYHDLLANRLAAAQIAVLALDELKETDISPKLKAELLANAGVRLVALKRNNTRRLYLAEAMPPMPDVAVDLRTIWWPDLLMQSFDCMLTDRPRVLRVLSYPRLGGGDFIDIMVDEAPIRDDLITFSERLFGLALVIAFFTSGLVFTSLYFLFVQPMKRVSQSMVSFQERPEDAQRIIVPSDRADEIGQAERVLATMQTELRQALQQREHLAALGAAVAKIQHDLRNILATAQLASDRLANSNDPTVKALAPRLMQSIDRAITLATNSLKYGKADEARPNAIELELLPLAEEAMHAAIAAGQSQVAWLNKFDPALKVYADSDQLLRTIINIGRNAVQALDGQPGATITVTANVSNGHTQIDLSDNGSGLPDGVRARLFEPFSRQGRSGGTGLGLAIARELVRGHGGDVTLVRSDSSGTTFRISLPNRSAHTDNET
ncbi:MAG: HAMP domain-containing sensor histidine kinase [Micropepsaceae bacterium]